jgi:hypothetical protein
MVEHCHELRQHPFKQVREGAALSILSSTLLLVGPPPVLVTWIRRPDRLTCRTPVCEPGYILGLLAA